MSKLPSKSGAFQQPASCGANVPGNRSPPTRTRWVLGIKKSPRQMARAANWVIVYTALVIRPAPLGAGLRLRLSAASPGTTAVSAVRTPGAAKAARTSRVDSTESKAARAQHRRSQRRAFQLFTLLG